MLKPNMKERWCRSLKWAMLWCETCIMIVSCIKLYQYSILNIFVFSCYKSTAPLLLLSSQLYFDRSLNEVGSAKTSSFDHVAGCEIHVMQGPCWLCEWTSNRCGTPWRQPADAIRSAPRDFVHDTGKHFPNAGLWSNTEVKEHNNVKIWHLEQQLNLIIEPVHTTINTIKDDTLSLSYNILCYDHI